MFNGFIKLIQHWLTKGVTQWNFSHLGSRRTVSTRRSIRSSVALTWMTEQYQVLDSFLLHWARKSAGYWSSCIMNPALTKTDTNVYGALISVHVNGLNLQLKSWGCERLRASGCVTLVAEHSLTSLPGSPEGPVSPGGPTGPGGPRSPAPPALPCFPGSPWGKKARYYT